MSSSEPRLRHRSPWKILWSVPPLVAMVILISVDVGTQAACHKGCEDHEKECGGTVSASICVDLSQDPDNCGACGQQCAAGCVDGSCEMPSLSITSDDDFIIDGETATLTFTLSTASSDFVEADIGVTGGTLSGFTAVTSVSYTAVLTPTPSSDAAADVTVEAGTFTDEFGESNTAAQLGIPVDTIVPTLVITSDETNLFTNQTATVTFTLSEASADFVLADVTVTNGSLSEFTAVSTTVYTVTFTAGGDNGVALISVPGATFTDAPGNPNTGATVEINVTAG